MKVIQGGRKQQEPGKTKNQEGHDGSFKGAIKFHIKDTIQYLLIPLFLIYELLQLVLKPFRLLFRSKK
ncbi:hypothetical protein GCM10009001_00610 [Virgibacillus siamensis]|uniref:Uncharacterized protein n=1 Tax=Virgibacillus siamensis TaxID=480071 RepID=A0ABN1FDI4_9BACI